tara:strand:+ start:1240 stop:1650 length:411 start_codon:yes stop_codon:yes gene_type:complete
MIGIVVEDLVNINLDMLNDSCNNDIIVFTDCVLPPKEYRNLSFFTKSLAYDFRETLVSTCVRSSLSILDMPIAKKKFLLLPPKLWIGKNFAYDTLLNVYDNSDIELLAISEDQKAVVSTFFKEPTMIQSILDVEGI